MLKFTPQAHVKQCKLTALQDTSSHPYRLSENTANTHQ